VSGETPPLRLHTSLRIGGPPEGWARPRTEAELEEVLVRAADAGKAARALGGGRNLLVDDRGVDGWVVSLGALRGVRFHGSVVIAESGASLAGLLGHTAARGLSGLEGLAGVPGTVGGAVRMNAGGTHGCIGERVLRVSGYDRVGERFRFDRRACGFRYRGSNLAGTFVTEVVLELEPTRADVRKRVREIFAAKRAAQPLSAATAGCLFKNPSLPGGESAGWLLDRVGLRGHSVGSARFSPVHANFVENTGGARFRDVLALAEEGRRRVLDRYGVDLELEVEVWMRVGPAAQVA
jgi:UDP-N-acetylmuramate dehydrogenase